MLRLVASVRHTQSRFLYKIKRPIPTSRGLRWFQMDQNDHSTKRPIRLEDTTPSEFLQNINLEHPSDIDRQKLTKIIQEVVQTNETVGGGRYCDIIICFRTFYLFCCADFVPRVVIGNLCAKYETLNIDEKKQFFLILARDLNVNPALVCPHTSWMIECSTSLLA